MPQEPFARPTSRDYRSISYWLETAGDDLTPRPSLSGSVSADVAILGAGYSGLWTAYYLLRHAPAMKVLLLEREIAGFGASGRNGGWASSGFPVSPALLERRYGREAAKSQLLAVARSIDEIGRVVDVEGMDAQFRQGGMVRIARGRDQVPAVLAAYESYRSLGLGDRYTILDRLGVQERVQVTRSEAGLFTPDCAVIHPGRLVRGLARAVEERGAIIFEHSPVLAYQGKPNPSLTTPNGEVRAQTIVLAGEAYLSQFGPLRRCLLPVYSLIALTERLPDEVWSEIGWQEHECISSFRYTVDYLSRTADGRILFGSRGAPYHFGSEIRDEFDRDQKTHALIKRKLVEWFPALEHSRLTHTWGGPVGMPRDWMPTASFDRGSGIATARGYTGQGVTLSNLAGRILAALIIGVDSPLTHLPMANHRSPSWEREPLRWAAVRYLQSKLEKIDERAQLTGTPPSGDSLPERLATH